MGTNPIEIGLILIGVLDEGDVLSASDLDLDTDGLRDNIVIANSGAYNLACNIRWFTPETMPTLLSKASSEALSVAIAAGVVNSETASLFISRANARVLAIASQLDSSALDEELAAALGAAAVSNAAATASEVAEDGGEAPAEVEEEEEDEGGFDGLGVLFG